MSGLPGTFDGRIVHHLDFHPRREFTGERVAIIGSGAAAARLLPGIAAEAARVTVFQTEAVWIVARAPRAPLCRGGTAAGQVGLR
ncbi:hypothetical protein [Nocardia neocaledoniensis]|uniref:hypothetical protein n=1 Tax=Nocardia neocaledoniensis TaxID=236511 RepID=UPI0024578823|nr:hypothetical protein [Nocardia neocaledoniensis]